MPVASNKFRTNDMVLATLLHMEGHKYEHELVHTDGRRGCIWVFDAPSEADSDQQGFADIIADFSVNAAEVEPRAFARSWAEVRRSMFDFLGRSR